jgi:hypothetical protein
MTSPKYTETDALDAIRPEAPHLVTASGRRSSGSSGASPADEKKGNRPTQYDLDADPEKQSDRVGYVGDGQDVIYEEEESGRYSRSAIKRIVKRVLLAAIFLAMTASVFSVPIPLPN